MIIRNLFQEDINRQINGVIKVDQDTADVARQEVKEYVITKELKKHFIQFFDYYDEAFSTPTADIGVWISGFFGSGKSHFLKMLSYILENKEIDGKKTVEYFRDKFADDPATFMLIDKATRNQTETILFNIDIEGSINKDKTAVLKVFAKMFYNHLGFVGENLKVAKLEQFIDKQGKTEQFRRVFKEKNGDEWLEARDSFAFFEDDIVETPVEVLGMSETAAHNWFDGTETTEMSIAQLVSEIKDYVKTKPKNFRLLFMIDEVGQYIGTDTDLLLNLQSLVEKIGSECGSNVWVRKADLTREIKSLISYAVGCMFGRYSLDVEGLVYAGGEWDSSKYSTYIPDADNIIPICDDEYFADDIVGKFVKFVEVVYGADTLEENLRFIANALGGKGLPRDVIRDYFLNGFYADHLKVYQKRPIYWLFDSGKKNGFKALIYMHRYQPDTLARMRTDYVHEQQARYRTAIDDCNQRLLNASGSDRVTLSKKLQTLTAQAEEIGKFEEKVHHLADMMISIDLDDGVKHNYEIFKDVLAPIK